jgi:hypothetical protein
MKFYNTFYLQSTIYKRNNGMCVLMLKKDKIFYTHKALPLKNCIGILNNNEEMLQHLINQFLEGK